MNKRQFKKKYLLCKDSFGKNLYAGDTVEIYVPMEMRSSWQSQIAWDMLHGAWVDCHPGHVKMGLGRMRELYSLLEPITIPIFIYGKEEPEYKTSYVKLVKHLWQ